VRGIKLTIVAFSKSNLSFLFKRFCSLLFLLKEKVSKKFNKKANAPLPFSGQHTLQQSIISNGSL
jgi:hypothetical protein